MKVVYTLSVAAMNGTVCMGTEVTSYSTRELAEKAKEAIEKSNASRVPQKVDPMEIYKDGELVRIVPQEIPVFPVICRISETVLYESESEVPILSKGL